MKADRTLPVFEGLAGRSGVAFTLFSFVFCVRAWLIKVWGSPVPYLDQWDADALGLFRSWLDGGWHWADLFAPHNEHRIVLTRLANLALLIACGNWNLWWQLLLNAILHAITAAVLVCLCWNDIPKQVRPVWVIGVALLFIAPAGWQNALWGFQSQVYFCSLLSVLALGSLLRAQPLKPRWWLGWLAAFLALFTVGSGVLAAVTALLLSTSAFWIKYFADRRSPSVASIVSLAAIFVVVAFGWNLRIEVPLHALLRAHSIAQFIAVFFRCLSWPWVDSDWLWLVLQAPFLWLIVRGFRQSALRDANEQFILGLGLLAIFHAAAVAYSRGAGLPEARPLSRYQDPLLLSVIANFVILLKFAGQSRLGRVIALLWAGTLLAGLLTLTTANFSLHLPFKRHQDAISLGQIRTYLSTNDAAVFTQEQLGALHPDVLVVRRVLDDPQLRRVLPREFFDTTARPPWLVECSSWLTLLSATALLAISIRLGQTSKT